MEATIVQDKIKHYPVLLKEIISIITPQYGGTFIDCTFGQGGYTKEILKNKDNKVIKDAPENNKNLDNENDVASEDQKTEEVMLINNKENDNIKDIKDLNNTAFHGLPQLLAVQAKAVTDLDLAKAYVDTLPTARPVAEFFGGNILQPVFDWLYSDVEISVPFYQSSI